MTRDDSDWLDAGIRGALGKGSVIRNLWIEHTKVGCWITPEGSNWVTDGVTMEGLRIRNTLADGINLCCGVTNSEVRQSHFRNTGDDAIAMWSFRPAGPTDIGNAFRFNTVPIPWKANCFGLYGGTDATIEDNACFDTANYSGLLIASSFNSHDFAGATAARRNTFVRAGGTYGGGRNGAVQIVAHEAPIENVVIEDTLIIDATQAGIQIGGPFNITGLTLRDIFVLFPRAQGIWIQGNARGDAWADGVILISPGGRPLQNDAGPAWVLSRGERNYGF